MSAATDAQGILQMMKVMREVSQPLAESVVSTLSAPELTRDAAENALDASVRFMAGVEKLLNAIADADEEDDFDRALMESASSFAKASHDFGLRLQVLAFNRLNETGGNGSQLLEAAQKRYYS